MPGRSVHTCRPAGQDVGATGPTDRPARRRGSGRARAGDRRRGSGRSTAARPAPSTSATAPAALARGGRGGQQRREPGGVDERDVGEVDDQVLARRSSAASSRRLRPVTLENVTSPRDVDDLRRHRGAPAPATRGGARRARCPSATAHWSTRYSPQPPGPSGVASGRCGGSKPGPSSVTLRCTMSARRAAARSRPCRWSTPGVLDRVGDQLGGQQAQVHRGRLAEQVVRPARARRRRRGRRAAWPRSARRPASAS